MFLHFLKIHCDPKLAGIAMRIDKLGIHNHFGFGDWFLPELKQKEADKLVRDFKEREQELQTKRANYS